MGKAEAYYLSAASTANARGATASLLLLANEAPDILPERWDAVFDPMAASTNATTVFAGTVWSDITLLARQMRLCWLVGVSAPASTGSRRALIRVMEPAQHRDSAYRPPRHRVEQPALAVGLGVPLLQAVVWPRRVEVGGVLAQHAPQTGLAEDQHMVQALAADAAEEPLAGRVLSWRAVGHTQDGDAARLGHARVSLPVFTVAVADEGARALVERGSLAQLLGDPGVGRVARRADMDDPPGSERDDEAGAQRAEEKVGDREEVAGPGVGGVVLQEGGLRLPARARGVGAAQVRLDGALGHAQAQLAQFTADAFRAPAWVLGRQPPDQGEGLGGERRAPRPRARRAPPERAEPRAMPTQGPRTSLTTAQPKEQLALPHR